LRRASAVGARRFASTLDRTAWDFRRTARSCARARSDRMWRCARTTLVRWMTTADVAVDLRV
jgi:hypothetical protein